MTATREQITEFYDTYATYAGDKGNYSAASWATFSVVRLCPVGATYGGFRAYKLPKTPDFYAKARENFYHMLRRHCGGNAHVTQERYGEYTNVQRPPFGASYEDYCEVMFNGLNAPKVGTPAGEERLRAFLQRRMEEHAGIDYLQALAAYGDVLDWLNDPSEVK